jgi:hypothetical protein
VNPQVDLLHIFARTGDLSLDATNGYTVDQDNITWEIQSNNNNTGISGTYNLKTGAWTNTTRLYNSNWYSFDSGSDLYLIPGNYNVRVRYRLKMGNEWTGDYIQSDPKSVTLSRGLVNKIQGHVTGTGASAINITVNVEPWGNGTQEVNF